MTCCLASKYYSAPMRTRGMRETIQYAKKQDSNNQASKRK